jgi:hypothetical protein
MRFRRLVVVLGDAVLMGMLAQLYISFYEASTRVLWEAFLLLYRGVAESSALLLSGGRQEVNLCSFVAFEIASGGQKLELGVIRSF